MGGCAHAAWSESECACRCASRTRGMSSAVHTRVHGSQHRTHRSAREGGWTWAQASTRFFTIPAAHACVTRGQNRGNSNGGRRESGEMRGKEWRAGERTVGVEEIVAGHAGLAGHTGGDHHNLLAARRISDRTCHCAGALCSTRSCSSSQITETSSDHRKCLRSSTHTTSASWGGAHIAAVERLLEVVAAVANALAARHAISAPDIVWQCELCLCAGHRKGWTCMGSVSGQRR